MARIRETFKGKDAVAHAWARQGQDRGREADRIGGRIFFEGPTIFSYGHHFPIATFFRRNKNAEKVVLFTTGSYSSTTAQHIWAARAAVSHFRFLYCLKPLQAAAGDHADNMRDFESNAQSIALKLAKAIKPERYIEAIAKERARMEEYAAYFGIGIKKYKFKYLFLESKEMAKAKTSKEIAEAKKAAEAMRIKREAFAREEAARHAKRMETERAEFYAFERDTVHNAEFTYLRFQPNEREIETSKGVRIAYNDGREHWAHLKTLQEAAQKGEPIAIHHHDFEGYQLRAVDAEQFEIGCHKITFAELDRVALECGYAREPYTMEGK